MRGVAVVLLLLSVPTGLRGKEVDDPPQTGFPVVEFYQGQSIYDLPGYEALMPLESRQAINITLTPATVQASVMRVWLETSLASGTPSYGALAGC